MVVPTPFVSSMCYSYRFPGCNQGLDAPLGMFERHMKFLISCYRPEQGLQFSLWVKRAKAMTQELTEGVSQV